MIRRVELAHFADFGRWPTMTRNKIEVSQIVIMVVNERHSCMKDMVNGVNERPWSMNGMDDNEWHG